MQGRSAPPHQKGAAGGHEGTMQARTRPGMPEDSGPGGREVSPGHQGGTTIRTKRTKHDF